MLGRSVLNVIVLSLSVLVLLLLYWALSSDDVVGRETGGTVQAQSARPLSVRVAPIALQGSIVVPRQFPGELEARQTSNLAFEFSGFLDSLSADEGDRVAQGQELARLDVDLLRAEREALLASRNAVLAKLTFAESKLARAERLRNRGAGSADQADQARAEREELVARIAEIDANLRQNEIRQEKSVLYAPFNGLIGARLVDSGNNITAGETILTVYDIEEPRFRVGLPTDLDPSLLYQPEIVIDGTPYPAVLEATRPDIDPSTRTRTVLFAIGRTDTVGQPGILTTKVEQNIIGAWVPFDAMRAGINGAWTILVVDAANVARPVIVEVLHIGNGRAFVKGAFDNGDPMIVEGAHKIAPGQSVAPQ